MAKITAIIDIGSNSCRMVVYQKTSRFAFHLLKEVKSKVVLSEGMFASNTLQPKAIERTIDAIKDFNSIAKAYKARKIICVATAAVRDAQNKEYFLKTLKDKTGISAKVINGEQEAKYGAIAAINLIAEDNFITVDIGGGSTELGFVKNKQLIKTISIPIGTIRLKELYVDKRKPISVSQAYILGYLKELQNEDIKNVVAIGGTLRAYAKIHSKNKNYPLNLIHGYEYSTKDTKNHLLQIASAKKEDLISHMVKRDRINTFREGAIIFHTILDFFKIEKVITSRAGVREGVYLEDILESKNNRFPENFNLSVRSLSDRFIINEQEANYNQKIAGDLFDTLMPIYNYDVKYKQLVKYAIKLARIGIKLNYYNRDENGFQFLKNGLTYGFSHKDIVLIAMISVYKDRKPLFEKLYNEYKALLPLKTTVSGLSKIVDLAKSINSDLSNSPYSLKLIGNTLVINPSHYSRIASENIAKIKFNKIKVIYENSYC